MSLGAELGNATQVDTTADGHDGGWVDALLDGRDGETALWFDAPVTRGELRAMVAERVAELSAAGLRQGGALTLRLPPSLGYVVSLLAGWRVGAQVSLLDHRLTSHEVDRALVRIAPQLVVTAPDAKVTPLRGFTEVTPVTSTYAGRPAATGHALLQLSSGSTGPSKVIGRTAGSLLGELACYRQIPGSPEPGERVVLLASMVHVLGLVGGLLYGLHIGAQVVVPRLVSSDGVLAAIAAGDAPTTVLGVPFHIRLMSAIDASTRLPQLKRMTVGGELVTPQVRDAFTERRGVPLGIMYGMTEVGVIATDMFGERYPVLTPAPGMTIREEAGQIKLATSANPYVGTSDPTRWVANAGGQAGGWLYTRDAGTVDPETGRVTVLGRLDSQVSVGGLKVDLTEVEQSIAELPGVAEVVVAYDGAIEAFIAPTDPGAEATLKEAMADRLAPYKRPRRITVLPRLPRTATGKLVRSLSVLRAAPRDQPIPHQGRPKDHSEPKERSAADVH